MSDYSAIFKAYDVRGLVPEQFDDSMARNIGSALARFLRAEDPSLTTVLVARDMRPSGVGLVAAFAEGVCEQGLDVLDLGLASTDLLYFAAGSLNAPGAMFTASHNPAQYNGIKFCRSGARPIGEESGLFDIAAMAATSAQPAEVRGTVSHRDLLDEFAEHVRSFVDREALRPLRVVADTANGMGGLVVPAVFKELPFDLEVMYGELDGTFPNHPADPIQPENQRDLMARVLEAKADVGLAFDGDADRVFLVDEKGIGLSGSTTTAILADAIVRRNGGGKVVYNLICSKSVPEVILEAGGEPIRSRVGHSFIKAVMAEEGAIFGGEHSAHYYFADNYRADSGLIAAVLVLEQMSIRDLPLSELRKPYERYAASGEINTKVDDPKAVIARVAAAYDSYAQDHLDGLTVDAGEWWFNLRPSNTEPLLRLNLEAATGAEVAARVDEVRSHFF
jgi:phosphomannomutase